MIRKYFQKHFSPDMKIKVYAYVSSTTVYRVNTDMSLRAKIVCLAGDFVLFMHRNPCLAHLSAADIKVFLLGD